MEEFINYVKHCKITHKQLADELGCSPVYIYQILNGRNPYPPSDHFRRKCYDWMKKCWACGQERDNG